MSKTEVLPNNPALTDLAGRINTEHAVCRSAMQKGLECADPEEWATIQEFDGELDIQEGI